jgi:hypothetical protein
LATEVHRPRCFTAVDGKARLKCSQQGVFGIGIRTRERWLSMSGATLEEGQLRY